MDTSSLSSRDSTLEKVMPSTPPPRTTTSISGHSTPPSIVVTPATRQLQNDTRSDNIDNEEETHLEIVRALLQSPNRKSSSERRQEDDRYQDHDDDNNDNNEDDEEVEEYHNRSSRSPFSTLGRSSHNSPMIHSSSSSTTPMRSSHLFTVFHTSPPQSTFASPNTEINRSGHGEKSHNTTMKSTGSSKVRSPDYFNESDDDVIIDDSDDTNFYTESVRRTLERKERTILDLQSQLTLLQQDRELEATRHGQEMNLMRGQMAERDEGMSQMRKQLLQLQHEHEIQIEKIKKGHNDLLMEEKKSGSQRLTALRDRIGQMSEEMERQKLRDQQQQEDIRRQQQKIEKMRESFREEINDIQRAHTQKLEAREEQYTENLAEVTRRIERESAQSTSEQLEALQTKTRQQQQKLQSEHRSQISLLEERIHELQVRTSVIPELEKQVDQYTVLKQDHSSSKQVIHALTQHKQQLEQQVYHLQEQGEKMEEMTAHMAQHNSVLQQQLDTSRQHVVQLEERTRNLELLQSELSHLKDVVLPEQRVHNDSLQQKQTELQSSTSEKFSRLSSDLHTILSMVMTAASASNFNEDDDDRDDQDNLDMNDLRNASMISLNESALFDIGSSPLVHFEGEDSDHDNDDDGDDDDDDDDAGSGKQSGTDNNTSLVHQLYQQTRYLISELASIRERYQTLSNEYDVSEREKRTADSIAQTLQEQLIEERRQCSDYQRTILHHEDQNAQLQKELDSTMAILQESQREVQGQQSEMRKLHTLTVRLLKSTSERVDTVETVEMSSEESDNVENASEYDTMIRAALSIIGRHHSRFQENLRTMNHLETKLHNAQEELFTTRQKLQTAWENMEKQRGDKERQRIEELSQQEEHHEQQMDSIIAQHTAKYQKLDQSNRKMKSTMQDLSRENMKLNMANDMLHREVKELSDERHALFNGIRLLVRGIRPMRQQIQDLRAQKQILSAMFHGSQEKLNQLHQTIDKYCSRVIPKESSNSPTDGSVFASSRGNSHHQIRNTLSLRVVVIAVIAHHRILRFARAANGETRSSCTISMPHGQERIQLLSVEHDEYLQKSMQRDTVQMNLLSDEVVGSDDPHVVVPCFLKLCTLFDHRTTQQIITGARSGTSVEGVNSSGLNSGANGSLMMHALLQGLQRMKRSDTGKDKHGTVVEDQTRQARHRLRAWRQQYADLQQHQTQLQRRTNDLQREMDRLTSNNADATKMLERRAQLVEYMEERIRTLEAESVRTVPTEKYSKLEKELSEAKRHSNILERDLSDAKKRADKWHSELEEARSKIRRHQSRVGELEQELKDSQENELQRMAAQLSRERERTLKLQKENKKYQYLMQDMQSRLYFEGNNDDSNLSQESTNNASMEKHKIHEPKSLISNQSPSADVMYSERKSGNQFSAADRLVEEMERDLELAKADILDMENMHH